MRKPAVVLILSLVAAALVWFRSGSTDSDLFRLALIGIGVSAVALLIASFLPTPAPRHKGARRVQPTAPLDETKALRGALQDATGPTVIIDGSNVLHWDGGVPSLAPVRLAIAALTQRGFRVGVIFDANVGYKIAERYQDDAILALQVDLPTDQVLVVPRGVSADEYILAAARQIGARILTNDRYRDWAEAHPEVSDPGHLIRGGIRDGKVWLNERQLAAA